MVTWRDDFEIEQTGLEIHEVGKLNTPALRGCGAQTPEDMEVCAATEYCEQVKGHAGPHASRLSVCNRPVGHDGDHALILLKPHDGFEELAKWT